MTQRPHPHHTDDHPRRAEEEYFVKRDAELIQRLRAQLDEQRQEQERRAHYMHCPKCGEQLVQEPRGDVRVDVCPNCHGMWLEAGELELIRHMSHGNPISGFMEDVLDIFRHRPK